MKSEYHEMQERAHAANQQMIERKIEVEFEAQQGRDNLQDLIRNFDTHAPLKTAKEVCATANALRIQTLMNIAVQLDDRGVESLIASAIFHRRYPKGA